MVAGIVLSLSRGRPLTEAVRFGVAAGAAAVMNPGTQLCRREDAERLFEQMSPAEPPRFLGNPSRSRVLDERIVDDDPLPSLLLNDFPECRGSSCRREAKPSSSAQRTTSVSETTPSRRP